MTEPSNVGRVTMRVAVCSLVAALAVALIVDDAMAQQRPGGRDGRPGGDRQGASGDGGGRGSGRSFGGPPNPLMMAIDANKDGELSSEEIANAAAALKKLDKNNDGKLSREELRPQFGGRSGSSGGGGFLEGLLKLDKNGDGKITKDELPNERMARIIEHGDTNKDGALDKAEIEKMRSQFGSRGGRSGGSSGGRGRPQGGGDRPQRPQRPDA